MLDILDYYNGYDSTDYSNFSINEIDAMSTNDQLDMLLNHKTNGKKVYVKYYLTTKQIRPQVLDEVIEDLYNELTFMYNAHYPRAIYLREGWPNVLGNISNILMYYYNRLAFRGCLKKKNSNYNYLKMCIELWFKLCQKYNLYLVLCYLDSAKKVNRNIKAIKLRPIKNFTEFRIAPLVTDFKIHEHRIKHEQGLLRHHHLLTHYTPADQRRY